MTLSAAIAGFTAYETFVTPWPEHAGWQQLFVRLAAAVFFSIPAIYCVKESSRHREDQRRYRQMAVDLNTITPYLRDLPQEDAQALKKDLASRIFGQTAKPVDTTPIDINKVIELLVEKASVDKSKN